MLATFYCVVNEYELQIKTLREAENIYERNFKE